MIPLDAAHTVVKRTIFARRVVFVCNCSALALTHFFFFFFSGAQ